VNVACARLEPVIEALPPGFETMRAEARAEGYHFLDRLAADWASGTMRFEREGEVLLAAYSAAALAGVGGLTFDPIVEGALRMRRFYVRPLFRRRGIGRAIAAALLDHGLRRVGEITLNAAAGSVRFWEGIGFVPEPRDGHTHILSLKEQ
jgi:GNAT superfamily N-acetyltransferase